MSTGNSGDGVVLEDGLLSDLTGCGSRIDPVVASDRVGMHVSALPSFHVPRLKT